MITPLIKKPINIPKNGVVIGTVLSWYIGIVLYNGDLIFNGIASRVDNTSQISGLQGDFSYKLNDKNILRSGIFFSSDVIKSAKNTGVFPADDDGNQTSDEPFNIADSSRQRTNLYGVYLQNEWKKIKDNWGGLKNLFVIRHINNDASPLLEPNQIFFLKENLQLKLTQAQWALLNRDASFYQNSLNSAIQWLSNYGFSQTEKIDIIKQRQGKVY